MKQITLDISDKLYAKLEKKSLDGTIRQSKCVGISDIIISILEKEVLKK